MRAKHRRRRQAHAAPVPRWDAAGLLVALLLVVLVAVALLALLIYAPMEAPSPFGGTHV